MLTSAEYVQALRDMLSRDPDRVREANRALYGAAVERDEDRAAQATRDADVALAAAGL